MNGNFPERIAPSLIERAKKLSTTQLCDGMKELHIPVSGCMCPAIKPVDPSMKVIGTAVTVETSNGDNLPIHLAAYLDNSDGYVMVIDGKGYMERAYLGDLIMSAAQAVGYEGIVIDGCARDRSGNIAIGFPVFCRGLTPSGPVKQNIGAVNEPIICGGVRVKPGDLVMGDDDGVCVVPYSQLEAVLEKAEAKLRYEEKRVKVISEYKNAKTNGLPLPQLAPAWVLEMSSN